MSTPIFYTYPIWMTGLIIVGILLISLELGFWIGRWWQRVTPDFEKQGSDIALTAMYGVLGLVLAFTYSFTISRADNRKQAVISEANAIGTAFLRADLAPEPMRSDLKENLREYTATRIIPARTSRSKKLAKKIIDSTLASQNKLWPTTILITETRNSPIEASIVQAINEVIDMHTLRMASAFDRLPAIVLLMLLFVGGVTVAVSGYNRGLAGDMNRIRMTALCLVLASVMTVITDFDRSDEGFIKVSQHSIQNLLDDIDADMQ